MGRSAPPPAGDLPPDAFFERARRVLPVSHHDALMAALTEPRPVWLRVNTLVATPQEVRSSLGVPTEPGPWPEALRVEPEHRSAVLRHDLYGAGAIYLQSLSSQAAAPALDPQPGEEIVDLCAAPGSKTSHLAALMRTGTLVANEVSKGRSHKLRAVLAQLRVSGRESLDVRVRTGDGVRFRGHRECFDRVLVDAPCSGEGRFHVGDPRSWGGWSPRKVKVTASKQKALLHAAIDATRPGGVIVYATCTLAPEENEGVLARALKRYDGVVHLEPLPVPLETALPALTQWGAGKGFPPSIAEHARRIPPGPAWDGFFLARLRKAE
ncbi:MAG: RsmB/NOP family class I SAM-dependent RNA methyltransferase [Deltaproteobacteria bacterium]|nr:RsmB/NOP family class I SAM-dependent RNA methyltransferase [Deltaproteobacteria bacterium]